MKSMAGNISNVESDPWEWGVAIGRVRFLSPAAYTLCAVYLTCLGILATFGNGLVFFVLIRKKELRRKPHNMLLINMAWADLFISVFGYPFQTIASYNHRYIFGWGYCVYQGFITSTMTMTTMNTLVAISIYRYIAVCKPNLKHLLTIENTRVVIVVVWVYTILWTGAPLVGWCSYTIEPFGTSCSMDWTSKNPWDVIYLYILCFLFYLVPIVIMSICYYYVIKKTISLRVNTQSTLDIDAAKKFQRLKMEIKVSGMCFILVLVYFIVWSPYTFLSLLSSHYPDMPISYTVLPTMFAKLASMVNPYIYVGSNTAFKEAARKFLCERRNKVHVASKSRNNIKVTIDRTKEGIYIGKNEVHLPTDDSTFF